MINNTKYYAPHAVLMQNIVDVAVAIGREKPHQYIIVSMVNNVSYRTNSQCGGIQHVN